VNFVLIGQNPI